MPDPPFSLRSLTPPLALVVSGPSGVGKTVLCDRLVSEDSGLVHSVSATTRDHRSDEKDGVDYYFWNEPQFRAEIEKGQLLEWAEVYGHLYGTPRAPIEDHLRGGRSPVLNLDIQGGRSVKRLMPESVLVFVVPPSAEELEKRLRGRGTDGEDEVRRRLAEAREELEEWSHYDYLVVNDDLEGAVAQVRAILAAERARVSRLLAILPPDSPEPEEP